MLINALASSFLYGWGSSPFSSVTQFSSRANSLFVGLCGHLPGLPSYFSAPLKINWTLCKGGLKDSWEIYFICISFISFPLNCSATLNTKILSLLEGRRFINDMFVTLLHFASKREHAYRLYDCTKAVFVNLLGAQESIPNLAESIPRDRLLGSISVYKYGLRFLPERICLPIFAVILICLCWSPASPSCFPVLAYIQIWKTFISINYSDIVYLVLFTTYCVQYVYMGDCNKTIY